MFLGKLKYQRLSFQQARRRAAPWKGLKDQIRHHFVLPGIEERIWPLKELSPRSQDTEIHRRALAEAGADEKTSHFTFAIDDNIPISFVNNH